MPQSPAGGRSAGNDFGTMLEIRSVRTLPDHRSMVETRGIYPFRIMERGTMDGYMVARIERCIFPLSDPDPGAPLLILPSPPFLNRISDYSSLHPDTPGDSPSIPPPVSQIINAELDVQATLSAASGAVASSMASRPGPPLSHAQEVQELVDMCLAFLDQIQRGAAPWVVQRLNRLSHIYGPMPTDPSHFSYWMAMVSTFPPYIHPSSGAGDCMSVRDR
jgi:hypothetical protein